MGAEKVIGVSVIPKIKIKVMPHNIASLVDRGLDILLTSIDKYLEREADIVLSPVTERITSFGIKRGPRLIELGEMCIEKNIEQIKRVINNE